MKFKPNKTMVRKEGCMKEIVKFVLVAAFFLAGMRLVIAAGEQGAAMGTMMTNETVGNAMMANMMMNNMMGNEVMGNQVMNQVMPEAKQMMNEMKDTMMPEDKAKDGGY